MEVNGQCLPWAVIKGCFRFYLWRPFINKPSNHLLGYEKNPCYRSKLPQPIPTPATGTERGSDFGPGQESLQTKSGFLAKWIQSSPSVWGHSRKTLHQPALLIQSQSGKQPLAFTALITKLRTKTINFTTASNTGASASVPTLARSPYLCHAGINRLITPNNTSCHWWQFPGSKPKQSFSQVMQNAAHLAEKEQQQIPRWTLQDICIQNIYIYVFRSL